jgi:hypothetical protein
LGSDLVLNQESESETESDSQNNNTEDSDDETHDETNHDSEDETNEEQHDSDEDGVEDEREKADEREMKADFDSEENELKVESTLKSGESKNKFEFKIEANERVEFEFKFKKEASNVESEISTRFEFRDLTEFLDNTSNPNNFVNGFDDSDSVLQIIDLHDLNWTLVYNEQTINNVTIYNIVVSATLGSMVIEFTFFISSSYTLYVDNATLLQPSSVKFNVEISNFPFSDSNSMLAVQLKMKHETETENDEKIEDETEDEAEGLSLADEQQIKFSNSSVDSFFSWITTYEADGVNKTIVVSPVTDDDDGVSKRKMYFNFVQAQKLFWDPKVGVTRATTSLYVPTNNAP